MRFRSNPARATIATLLMTGAAASTGLGQDPRARDSVAVSARVAIAELRTAVAAGDWNRVGAYLPPAPSPWTEAVRTQFARPDTSTYSFWRRDSRLMNDSLTITVLGRDSVAVGAPLRVGGHTGHWGAVLHRQGSRWHLGCTSEQFGPRPRHTPGCAAVHLKPAAQHGAPPRPAHRARPH